MDDQTDALLEAGAAFRYCPACGNSRIASLGGRVWRCPDCGFEYFHNVATAAGIIIEAEGSVLLLKRAREPSLGLYAIPGGFADPGERAEEAALRECREELGWAPSDITFLASFPNIYRYRGIPYSTCDLYFYASASMDVIAGLDPDPDETAGVMLAQLRRMPWESIAFESTLRALRLYTELR